MKNKKVRLGVVGTGIWGRMHIRAYIQHPSAELVAICDLDEKRAQKIAKEFKDETRGYLFCQNIS